MKSLYMLRIFLIAGLCLLVACQNVQSRKKMDNLDKSITNFEVALRWAQYQDVYSYHVNPEGEQPEANLDLLEEVSVTGINVLEKLINDEQSEAFVRMIVSYYNKNRGTVRELKLEQQWWYNETNKQWFIKSDFPEFK